MVLQPVLERRVNARLPALARGAKGCRHLGRQPDGGGHLDRVLGAAHRTATAHRLGVLRGGHRLVVNQRGGVAKERLVQLGGVIGVNPGFGRVWQFRVHWRTSWK